MGPSEIFATVGMLAFIALTPIALPRIWHNRSGFYVSERVAWWPFGRVLWRGVVRAAPVCVVSFCLALPLWAGLLIAPDSEIVVMILFPPIALQWFFIVTIVLFNWPKRLVPPHLRALPGAIAEWGGAKPPPVPRPDTGHYAE